MKNTWRWQLQMCRNALQAYFPQPITLFSAAAALFQTVLLNLVPLQPSGVRPDGSITWKIMQHADVVSIYFCSFVAATVYLNVVRGGRIPIMLPFDRAIVSETFWMIAGLLVPLGVVSVVALITPAYNGLLEMTSNAFDAVMLISYLGGTAWTSLAFSRIRKTIWFPASAIAAVVAIKAFPFDTAASEFTEWQYAWFMFCGGGFVLSFAHRRALDLRPRAAMGIPGWLRVPLWPRSFTIDRGRFARYRLDAQTPTVLALCIAATVPPGVALVRQWWMPYIDPRVPTVVCIFLPLIAFVFLSANVSLARVALTLPGSRKDCVARLMLPMYAYHGCWIVAAFATEFINSDPFPLGASLAVIAYSNGSAPYMVMHQYTDMDWSNQVAAIVFYMGIQLFVPLGAFALPIPIGIGLLVIGIAGMITGPRSISSGLDKGTFIYKTHELPVIRLFNVPTSDARGLK